MCCEGTCGYCCGDNEAVNQELQRCKDVRDRAVTILQHVDVLTKVSNKFISDSETIDWNFHLPLYRVLGRFAGAHDAELDERFILLLSKIGLALEGPDKILVLLIKVIRASYVAVAHIAAFPDKPLPKELESVEPVEVDQTETEDVEDTIADYPQKEHCVELLRVAFQQLLDHSVPVKQTCKTVKELQDCFDLWKKIGQVASSEITCYTRRSEHSVQLFRRFIDAENIETMLQSMSRGFLEHKPTANDTQPKADEWIGKLKHHITEIKKNTVLMHKSACSLLTLIAKNTPVDVPEQCLKIAV